VIEPVASAEDAKPADKPGSKSPTAAPEAKKRNPMLLAAAAVGLIAVVGAGAFALRGGSSAPDTNGTQIASNSADNSAATVAAVGPAGGVADTNVVANAAQTPAAAPSAPAANDQSNSAQALAAEKAKTAAAEAQLAALKKASAKTPSLAASATTKKAAKATTNSTEAGAAADAAISPATMAQFNATVDDARSLAKQVMRSAQGQNVQTAKNYDNYLKTLKASMRGISTERDAQRLLKQAEQTRAYIASLQH
jgi:non-specific serine/threonine protein kinase